MATRVWKSMFGTKDNLEKELQNLANLEMAVKFRIKRRSRSSLHLKRHVIKFSIFLEFLVVIYAIVMARQADLSWQIRSLSVVPVIGVPALAAIIYSLLSNLRKLLEEKDKQKLESLQEERQTKVNELKEKSNYYATQVLIQRYDLDPAEQAAAATILASKLGCESGLKLSIGDQRSLNLDDGDDDDDDDDDDQKELDNYKVSGGNNDGWFAHIAALLVGEHPSQCFALICSKCFMHNGFARKEDLAFIRYYCPHCRALNESQQNESTVVPQVDHKNTTQEQEHE